MGADILLQDANDHLKRFVGVGLLFGAWRRRGLGLRRGFLLGRRGVGLGLVGLELARLRM